MFCYIVFGNILYLRNILTAFDKFEGNEIIAPINLQDYTGIYHDFHEKYKLRPSEKDNFIATINVGADINADWIRFEKIQGYCPRYFY